MKAGYGRRTPSPEELELERKRREFHLLERRLAKLEHELDDLREEIGEFEKIYAEKMAARLRELDQLKQELARAEAAGSGDGEKPRPRCRSGLRDEKPAREEIPQVQTGSVGTAQNESIRVLYRKVAKAIHPDLAGSEDERKRRQKLMAEANRAYAEEDRVTLQAILEEWELSPEAAVVVGTAGELALLTRRTARLEECLRSVEREIARLRNSEIYRLVQRVEEAKWRGRDIIAEMAANLDNEILAVCRMLNRFNRPRRVAEPELPAAPPADVAYRTVRFPPDRPLGTLFVRERSSGNFLDWKRLGEALGDVAVPAGKSLRLDIREEEAAGIDLLATLAPDDLQACFLYGASDNDLTHILRLTGLEELYLAGDGITGEGLLHLLELKRLERIYLYDTRVSDAGLVCLRHLPRLRSVTLCNAPVTDAGVNRLRLALPSCRVVTLQSGRR
ncbi:hypothetical protein [Geobacter sp.]|uniref:hypothetical protein n=1 Tax=Geobacter sp. TaxID=46610 RepID=UPI0026175B00|nr:hypothetical protein [Geobacter sp.]